ncbi:MAG: DUF3991 domain-containing protein [Clostridia bacterium]|nr:DUF3991 domain-containing protein [Clostridia bacterium]
MAKYTVDQVESLIKRSINRVASSSENWADFLKKSANFYKYSFSDQLVITQLRPEATAVATFSVWTNKLHSKIKRGSTGIPLITSDEKIEYVFDISDTNSEHKLWKFENVNVDSVSAEISSNINDINDFISSDLENQADVYTFVYNSLMYIVSVRLGLDTLYEAEDFDYIKKLNIDEVNKVGNYLSEKSNKILSHFQKLSKQHTKSTKAEKRNNISFTPEEIDLARSTNLVDFLQSNGENLKRVGNGEYTMDNHDSMRISESRGFYWNSQNISGNAVDFCVKYYDMPFQEAVSRLLAFNGYRKDIEYNRPIAVNRNVKEEVRQDLTKEDSPSDPLPNELDTRTNRVYAYLTKTRGIDGDIVNRLINEGKIAQDTKGNAVFKIFDLENPDVLSGAEITGTLTDKRYKQVTERNGNGFTINPTGEQPEGAIFFESAIDLLSFYNLRKDAKILLVSMAGLKDKVLLKTMKDYNLEPRFCYISSDNDEAGVKFASKMEDEYGVSVYRVTDDEKFEKHTDIKDWNDLLRAEKNLENPMVVEPVQNQQENPIGPADNIVQNQQNSKYDFLDNLEVGSRIKFDNDIWEVIKINGESSIEIKNINNKEYVLPIISSSIAGTWRDILSSSNVEIIDKEKSSLGGTINIDDGSNTGLSILSFLSENDVYKANYEYNGIVDMGVVWQQGDNYYISTGSAREHNLKFHYFTPKLIDSFEKFVNEPDIVEEKAKENIVVANFRNKTKELFNNIGSLSYSDIEELAKEHIQSVIDDNNIDVDIVDVVLTGSRARGLENQDSDIDIVVEFKGDEREDFLFNILNESNFDIEGITFDINPINEYQTGTLESYLPIAEKFLDDKKNPVQDEYKIPDIVIGNMPDNTITIEERNNYGYKSDYLLPLNTDKAVELFKNCDLPIYRLYDDDTESLVENVEEIENFNGIFGIETVEWVRHLEHLKSIEQVEQSRISELPSERTENYRITDTQLGIGTQKEKYHNNIAAIKTLFNIEVENRQATSEEQEILAKYVGWGGLDDVFDSRKTAWANEYAELKELLNPEEYAAACSSTLNAHYTSPIIINTMYKALSNMEFEKGKILEPAMGIGNFFGMLPENMNDSKLYGVEIDSISGRIAKQLYPNAHIQIKPFEKTSFKSNSFDVAIGNVPFGSNRIYDPDFKDRALIHDYFFKKTLDKVRSGGVIAFITSKGTMDKQDNSVRKYLAERAELLGAIRLPNNAFKANAGTDVTSDIIFFQKRDRLVDFTQENIPEWVNLTEDANGIKLNTYFANHREMILGEMTEISGRYGMETACIPIEGANLSMQLEQAVQNIKGTITPDNVIDTPEEYQDINTSIIAENYRNFCYAVIDGDIYYRENDNMIKQDIKGKRAERLKGMVEISETLRELISAQRDDFPDSDIKTLQNKLNVVYDSFTAEYGILSSKANKNLFRDDDTVALLLALENLDKDGNIESKADIFFKRTILPYSKVVESVDTASEALAVSIGEKGRVDIDYMAQLCSKSKEEIIKELEGVIFENPVTGQFENADEYLSGNVREKLSLAKSYAAQDSKFDVNVKSLEAVQPEDLKPSEISAQLGSTWIPVKYYQQFMYELLDTPWWSRGKGTDDAFGLYNNSSIVIDFDAYSSSYGISNRGADSSNVKANTTYGTSRMNAYRIIEATLNMKPIRIFDYIEDEKGNKRAVLNNTETLLAQEKQALIKNKFNEWIFDDSDRAKDLCNIYNQKFNSIRPREYDGSHITFKEINPEISLRKHQIDAIAHTLYGGNTLLAHTVGAGKSFEMIASSMESKRLGLCNKSMIVVPKAIVNQIGKEFLQLYPTANILIPTEKDFSKENRERFCSRIATGNYDAIILSHNQLEKIPLSLERQISFIQEQLNEVEEFLLTLHSDSNTSRGFTVKQLESTKKNLTARLEKLNNADKRDTVITFEEMGVDKLYIDEAHFFKNKYFYTKMDRVAGINSSSASQRAEDLFMKCRYLDEKTNNKGVVFATGTPVSNSMTEMYTMQTYLQYDKLKSLGLNHFDSWASTFGETQVALELAPEGKGYKMKTRFSKFFNLPELMNTFKAVADIKTADMLNLPVPKANYHTVATEASEYQKDLVDGLANRAEAIRAKKVDISEDNMLNITNDGRKLALDQRLANPLLPDDPNSKVNVCVNNVYDIWQNTENRSTQIIFSDLSTPHYDGTFNIYDDIKNKLIEKGIPESEIAFIHDCKTDEQKLALFTRVQEGDVRVLLGSTSKLGTGTNCQNKLKAVHHLDCPYRPSDLEQRNGRIIRQGNENSEVDIFNYVTKGTFDAYLYQLVENKQKFISQIMTSKSPARSAEDIDECVLSYAEIKALAAGDPKIKEKMDLDVEVNRLRAVFANYQDNKQVLQENINVKYPEKIQKINEYISAAEKDAVLVKVNTSEKFSGMTVDGAYFSDKKEAGTAFLESCRNIRPDEQAKPVGEYKGFKMYASFDRGKKAFVVNLKGHLSYSTYIGADVFGNITRLDNLLNSIDIKIKEAQSLLTKTEYQLKASKKEVNKPFEQLSELREKESRLEQLNRELSINNNEDNYNISNGSCEDISLEKIFEFAEIEANAQNNETYSNYKNMEVCK